MSRILHAIAIRINRPHSLIHLRYARQSPSHISFARLHFSSFFSAVARSINYGATLGSSALLTYFYHARRNQLSTRKLTEARRKDFCAEYFRSHFSHSATFSHARFSLEKPNVSRYTNSRPRGKIQIPAASAPRDGKLSFAHSNISFITSRRENAYGIVSEMSERPEGHADVVFSSPSKRASVFGFRFFNFVGFVDAGTLQRARQGISFRTIA